MKTDSVTPGMLHVWSIYLEASEEARRRGDRRVGTEHILLALFEDPSIEIFLGVDRERARATLDTLDVEALAVLGFASEPMVPAPLTHAVPVKPRLRDVAKKDRLRMSSVAKGLLERAVKPNRRKTYVFAHQVLVQILDLRPPDPATSLLLALGVDPTAVRRRLGTLKDENESH